MKKMIYLMNIWTIKSVMNSMNQIKIIKNVSIVAGKGIPSFCVMKLVRSEAGIVSWLYVIIAI